MEGKDIITDFSNERDVENEIAVDDDLVGKAIILVLEARVVGGGIDNYTIFAPQWVAVVFTKMVQQNRGQCLQLCGRICQPICHGSVVEMPLSWSDEMMVGEHTPDRSIERLVEMENQYVLHISALVRLVPSVHWSSRTG